jgi:hypothetical protein
MIGQGLTAVEVLSAAKFTDMFFTFFGDEDRRGLFPVFLWHTFIFPIFSLKRIGVPGRNRESPDAACFAKSVCLKFF